MRQILASIICFVFTAISVGAFAAADTSYTMIGTYYADYFVGRKTSNGEIFSHEKFTCAHKTIPLGTYVEVTNPKTNQKVVLKVNDRCPKNNVLDMTRAAIAAIGIKGAGKVQVRILGDVKLTTPPSTLRPYNPDEPPYGSAAYYEQTGQITKVTSDKKKSNNKSSSKSNNKKSPAQGDDKKHSSKKKEKQQPTASPKARTMPKTYDILLCTERTLHSAELHASLLDPVYLPNLEYKQLANGKYQLIIRLGMTKDQLLALTEEIELEFPRLQLIPTDS